jgi:hypothetical protein
MLSREEKRREEKRREEKRRAEQTVERMRTFIGLITEWKCHKCDTVRALPNIIMALVV